jgi:hypothetical protein
MPIWRKKREAKPERSSEAERELIREMRDLGKGATATEHVSLDAADFMVMERVAPVQVGKWRIMPPVSRMIRGIARSRRLRKRARRVAPKALLNPLGDLPFHCPKARSGERLSASAGVARESGSRPKA